MQGRKEARGMGEAGLGWPCGPGQSLDSLLRATGSPGMVSTGVASSDLESGRVTLRLHVEERLGEQRADRPTRAEMRTLVSVPL